MNDWIKLKSKIPQNNFLEIKLESLINNNSNVLKECCEFYEIPFSKSLLKIDLDKSVINKWKYELEEKEIEKLNKKLFKYINLYKYD